MFSEAAEQLAPGFSQIPLDRIDTITPLALMR